MLLPSCCPQLAGVQAADDVKPRYLEQRELGNRLAVQARTKFDQIDKDSDQKEKNARSLAEVRSLYAKARDAYAAAIRDLERISRRDRDPQLEATYVELQLAHAVAMRELAWTYAKNAPERATAMGQAAAAFHDLHQAYQRRLAGMYAQLCEADCYRAMDDSEKALAIYEELLECPDDVPQLRAIKLGALRRAMTCWSDKRHRDDDRIIQAGSRVVDDVAHLDHHDSDTLAIRLYLAYAYLRRAAASRSQAQKAEALRLAADHAHFVAKLDKQRAKTARKLLQDIPADIVADSEAEVRRCIDNLPAAQQQRPD
jgi:tetratricopeptide (TPR) repeat protein